MQNVREKNLGRELVLLLVFIPWFQASDVECNLSMPGCRMIILKLRAQTFAAYFFPQKNPSHSFAGDMCVTFLNATCKHS